MPRYSIRESFNDGDYAYDDRYDAGEYITYGQSRGPSSNAYSDGTPHHANTSSRRARQSAYDAYGYPYEGSHAGEEDLRRRTARYYMGESTTSRTDQRERLGRHSQNSYDAGRRSRLSEQIFADDRDSREARRLDHMMQQEQERCNRRREALGPGPQRGTFILGHERNQREAREQQMRDYEDLPENVRKYGRGYFPAYEYR